MIEYHEGLRKLIEDKLNSNPYNIIFDVALYKNDNDNYYREYEDEVGYGVTTKQIVPVVISSIIGSYINIPNISVTDNNVSVEYDLFLGDYQDLDIKMQERFKSVDYNSTLLSIDYLTKQLLAQYHPLGDVRLRFGGESSNASLSITSSFSYNFIYIKGEFLDGSENILGGATQYLTKDDDNIYFTNGVDTLSVPYTNDIMTEIIVYNDGGWVLKNLTNGIQDTSVDTTAISFSTLNIGATTGFSGTIDTLALNTTQSASYTKDSGYTIELYDFDSKTTFTNKGTGEFDTTNEINNCILWGSAGNAIFSFETLYPTSDIRYFEGMPYQRYRTDIGALVSNDVLFGNNFEYYLIDGAVEYQIFPIDRNHTYAGVANTAQKIMSNYGTTIIDENAKEMTHTFFYNGDRNLTKILKHVTKNDQTQNQEFQLRIQYPFYQETYDVLIDSGGTSPNLNNLSTFSVTYKQIDPNLVGV